MSAENSPIVVVNRRWLIAPAFVGAVMVLGNLVWVARHGQSEYNVMPGVVSDIGLALVLFSVIFWLERRAERRLADTIRRLTSGDARDPRDDSNVFGDFHEPGGPLEFAQLALQLISESRYDDLWMICDPNFRTCRAQAWIFNNLVELNLPDTQGDQCRQMLEYLYSGPHPGDQLWRSFARIEANALKTALDVKDPASVHWSNRRRIVGPAHEVVIALPDLPPSDFGYRIESETRLSGAGRFLMQCVPKKDAADEYFYLLAGLNVDSPPMPGWPPSFWIAGDPVARASHPGANL